MQKFSDYFTSAFDKWKEKEETGETIIIARREATEEMLNDLAEKVEAQSERIKELGNLTLNLK